MSTRATYLFSNTSMAGEDVCIYIHHDGYPSGAAQYLSNAKHRSSRDRRPLLESFIAANKGAQITHSHQAHGDTDYRYYTNGKYLTAHQRIISLQDDGFSSYWKVIFSESLDNFILEQLQTAEALA
tara:strand:+ start:187 stop:564 length:378 start_codon:yes stop_codon:yes gene_type:complete